MNKILRQTVTVVIPVYRRVPQPDEIRALRQCARIFKNRAMTLIAPYALDLTPYRNWLPGAAEERFADEYFTGIPGYNRLLLSESFYRRFESSEFILIHQPDAWVFRDELDEWCKKPYDFIGAPVFPGDWEGPSVGNSVMLVGNGGFSLRRIAAFRRILSERRGSMYNTKRLFHFMCNHLRSRKPWRCLIPLIRMTGLFNRRAACMRKFSDGRRNEDMVFHELSNAHTRNGLRFAPLDEAIRFSWEKNAPDFFRQTGCLPFGCHAWRKYHYEDFWSNPITASELNDG